MFQGLKKKLFFLCIHQKPGVRVEWEDAGEEEEEEEAEGDVYPFTSQHECPLVQQKVNKYTQWSSDFFNHDSLFAGFY